MYTLRMKKLFEFDRLRYKFTVRSKKHDRVPINIADRMWGSGGVTGSARLKMQKRGTGRERDGCQGGHEIY